MYAATTRDILVQVQPKFLEDQSEPDEGYFVWAYSIRIENTGRDTVQLINRHSCHLRRLLLLLLFLQKSAKHLVCECQVCALQGLQIGELQNHATFNHASKLLRVAS